MSHTYKFVAILCEIDMLNTLPAEHGGYPWLRLLAVLFTSATTFEYYTPDNR